MARNGNHTKELIARTALRLFVDQGITERSWALPLTETQTV